MGCDIHICCEEIDTTYGVEKWFSRDQWSKNPYFGSCEYEEEYRLEPIYRGRNYYAFAALCGVRDRDDSPKISEPRGLPEDATPETKKESQIWGVDGHSHSWVTLGEIIRFIESNKSYASGYINQEQAKQLEEGKSPDSWCQWSSDKSLVFRKWELPEHPLKSILNAIIGRIWKYGVDVDRVKPEALERIRIVFWFDN